MLYQQDIDGCLADTIGAIQILGVNAFDQPAVEDGKIPARQCFAGMGG